MWDIISNEKKAKAGCDEFEVAISKGMPQNMQQN